MHNMTVVHNDINIIGPSASTANYVSLNVPMIMKINATVPEKSRRGD